MDNVKRNATGKLPPFTRRLIQLYSALLHNAHLKGFLKGEIYRGKAKYACVPGLNCYSCPGAVGACPIGSLQNSLGALKFLGIISISIAFSVLLALSILPDGLLAAKIEPFEKLEIFPSVFLQERQVLAKIASKVWSENLWIGTGLGTFSLDVRFNAQPADWDILCTVRENAMNGWLNLAAERGLVGIVAFAIPLIMLVVAFIRRIPGTIRKTVFMPGCYLAFAALALIAAVTFFDTSLFSSSGVMSMSAVLALGVASIPPKRKETKEESSTEEKK